MESLVTGDVGLGQRYVDGACVRKHPELAVHHFKVAPYRGGPAALFTYGFRLKAPIGTSSNYSESERLIARTSSQLHITYAFFKE
jgi:hypothetical protein